MDADEPVLKKGKPEEELIRKYWNWRTGTLVREFEMVKKDKEAGIQFRRLDAIIILNGDPKEITRKQFKDRGLSENDEVEFIQAKASRLGMSLMGQTIFSRSLMNEKLRERGWKLKARRWIALCKKSDKKLGDLLSDYGIDVVIPEGKGFVVVN